MGMSFGKHLLRFGFILESQINTKGTPKKTNETSGEEQSKSIQMKIVVYSFCTLFIHMPLPAFLPESPTFPSGNLPGLGVFS